MKKLTELTDKVITALEHDEKARTIAAVATVLLAVLVLYDAGTAVGKFLYYLIH